MAITLNHTIVPAHDKVAAANVSGLKDGDSFLLTSKYQQHDSIQTRCRTDAVPCSLKFHAKTEINRDFSRIRPSPSLVTPHRKHRKRVIPAAV